MTGADWEPGPHPKAQPKAGWSRCGTRGKSVVGALCWWCRFCSAGLGLCPHQDLQMWCKFWGCSSCQHTGNRNGLFISFFKPYFPHNWKTSHEILITGLSWAVIYCLLRKKQCSLLALVSEAFIYPWQDLICSFCSWDPPQGLNPGSQEQYRKATGPKVCLFCPKLRCWQAERFARLLTFLCLIQPSCQAVAGNSRVLLRAICCCWAV